MKTVDITWDGYESEVAIVITEKKPLRKPRASRYFALYGCNETRAAVAMTDHPELTEEIRQAALAANHADRQLERLQSRALRPLHGPVIVDRIRRDYGFINVP